MADCCVTAMVRGITAERNEGCFKNKKGQPFPPRKAWPFEAKEILPSKMSKCLVSFGHPVDQVALFYRFAGTMVGI